MTWPPTAGVPSRMWLSPLASPSALLSQSTDSALILSNVTLGACIGIHYTDTDTDTKSIFFDNVHGSYWTQISHESKPPNYTAEAGPSGGSLLRVYGAWPSQNVWVWLAWLCEKLKIWARLVLESKGFGISKVSWAWARNKVGSIYKMSLGRARKEVEISSLTQLD